MAVKIRLKRMGKIRTAIYRVVVMDSRTKRDGRAIEEIGKYDPNQEPSLIEIDMERANYWRGQGAQPTEAVAALLKIMDEGTLKVAEPKANKKDLYEAALAAAGKSEGADASGATTAKKKAAPKKAAAADKADEAPKADEPKAEEVAPAADTDSGAASADGVDADADDSATEAAPAEAAAAESAPAESVPAVEAKPETVDAEAVEEAVEAEVVREEEAERSVTSEKGEGPAKGEGS